VRPAVLALAHQGDGRPPPLRRVARPVGRASDGGSGGMGFGDPDQVAIVKKKRCFPFPFPHDPIGGKREAPLGSGVESVALGGSADAAGREELGENVADVAGAHAGDIAQLALGEGRFAVGQDLLDTLQGGGLDRSGRLSWVAVDDSERERRWICAKGEAQPILARCGAMLNGKIEVLALSAQIEVGVAPGVQFGGSAQRLATAFVRSALAGVVHEGDRGVQLPLDRA